MHARHRLRTIEPRLTATYEKIAAGLAAYISAAIQANAARHT